jgi:hypothetical protein
MIEKDRAEKQAAHDEAAARLAKPAPGCLAESFGTENVRANTDRNGVFTTKMKSTRVLTNTCKFPVTVEFVSGGFFGLNVQLNRLEVGYEITVPDGSAWQNPRHAK